MNRLLVAASVLVFCVSPLWAADADTPAAAKTRALLKKKISVDFKDTRLGDVVEELKEMVPGLKFRIDSKGGVSQNQTVTCKMKDATVAEILAKMFEKNGLGYIVISKKANAYDGLVFIKQGKERGYPPGEEPKDKK